MKRIGEFGVTPIGRAASRGWLMKVQNKGCYSLREIDPTVQSELVLLYEHTYFCIVIVREVHLSAQAE